MTSYRKSSFFALGPVSSALMCSTATATTGDKPGPPAKGAFFSEGDKDKQNEVSQSMSPQGASVCPPVEEFFWICGSIVAFSKWRIGYMVEKCMSSMQMGTQMVKLRGGSKGLVRFFYLDEHKSCIRWRPSRKNEKAKISVDSVREVCEGKQSEIFQRYSDGSFDPNCCFSLYYGEHMESLDLVSGTGEEARTWITGLKYLMAGISDEDSLAKRQRTRDQYPSAIQKGRGGVHTWAANEQYTAVQTVNSLIRSLESAVYFLAGCKDSLTDGCRCWQTLSSDSQPVLRSRGSACCRLKRVLQPHPPNRAASPYGAAGTQMVSGVMQGKHTRD
ncbi:hypothetical protein KUCAC02_012470 [Chaenocephalus aceratus]|uniref:Uncharacterized protein n=1 Tax=Chaenocephalus aceratus TaxID=36190 RepID=A0ACB9XCH7_CHAAC|nr:hypothetical protein KUCAC02_012470 [Chaenocephalus aceratus]